MPTNGGRRRDSSRVSVSREVGSVAPAVEATGPQQVTAPGKYRYWLVQRLEQRTHSDGTGFDSRFSLDYMGSAEFECGAVSQSLRRIRVAGDLVLVGVELIRDGITKTVYFVAPGEGLDEKIADFRVWFSPSYLDSKEWTNFDTLFVGDLSSHRRKYIQTVAWWSLSDDIAWTLDEAIALQLLEGFAPVSS